jgi:hypothetical protein
MALVRTLARHLPQIRLFHSYQAEEVRLPQSQKCKLQGGEV